MVFASLARITAVKFIMMLAALTGSMGSAAGGLFHFAEPRAGPIVLDRVVDGNYAVFLIGTEEIEVVVPMAGQVDPSVDHDPEARARIEAKLAALRARESNMTRITDE